MFFRLPPEFFYRLYFNGTSVLHVAAAAGDFAVTKWLLESGAEVNQRNANKETSLTFAVKYGSARVIRMLVGNGGEVENITSDGKDALQLATIRGDKGLIEFLKMFRAGRLSCSRRGSRCLFAGNAGSVDWQT